MPFASEFHFPWRKGSDGVPPKPDAGGAYFPGPTTSVKTSSPSPGESGANESQYSNQTLFYADCVEADRVGALVYAFDGIANVRTADSDKPYPVVGLIISKSSPTKCLVQRYGPVMGIVSGLRPNVRYFLHHDGGLFAPPFDGSDVEFVQQVGFALAPDAFFVQPTGTVIRRDPTPGEPVPQPAPKPLTISIGNGAPVDDAQYEAQDMYIDRDSGQVYFGPAAQPGNSLVYAGSGGPSDDNGPAQDFYYDLDTRTLYLRGDAADPAMSQVILGHGAPDDAEQVSTSSFYFDTASGEIFPKA